MDKLREFHQKIDNFFNDKSTKFSNQIQCKVKCDQCCHVDLSIFEIEKQNILEWCDQLDSISLNELIVKLKTQQEKGKDLFGNLVEPCVFLFDGQCSIYAARPTLCRTQGLPMIRKDEYEASLDCCPLNFVDVEIEIEDCLATDTVNLVLARLNMELDKMGKRTSLKEIKEMILDKYE